MEEVKSSEMLKKTRQIFYNSYANLSTLADMPPITAITDDVPNVLDIYGDGEDFSVDRWSLITLSLSRDKSLEKIAIRAKTKCTEFFEDIETEQQAREFKMKSLFHTGYLMTNLIVSVHMCLRGTNSLKWLTLEGLLIGKDYLIVLLKGVRACTSIEALSFINCSMKDECVEVICEMLKDVSNVHILEFSKCNICSQGGAKIGKMVAHQKELRKSDQNEFQGLKRINLNHNVNLGDQGATPVLEAIKTDKWIQAIDLQDCNLTNTSAYHALEVTGINKTICVIDIRANKTIDECILRQLKKTFTATAADPNYDWKAVEAVVRYRHKLMPIIPPPSLLKRHIIKPKNEDKGKELPKSKKSNDEGKGPSVPSGEEENGPSVPSVEEGIGQSVLSEDEGNGPSAATGEEASGPSVPSGEDGKVADPNVPGETSSPLSASNSASPAAATAKSVGRFTFSSKNAETTGKEPQKEKETPAPEKTIEMIRLEKLRLERDEVHRSICKATKEIEKARMMVQAYSASATEMEQKVGIEGYASKMKDKKKSRKAGLKDDKAGQEKPKDEPPNNDEHEDKIEGTSTHVTESETEGTNTDGDGELSEEIYAWFESLSTTFSEMLEEHMLQTEKRYRVQNKGDQYFEDPVLTFEKIMGLFGDILRERLSNPLKPSRYKGKRSREMGYLSNLVDIMLEGSKSVNLETPKQQKEHELDEIRNLMAKVLKLMKKPEKASRSKDKQGEQTEPCKGLPLAEPNRTRTKGKGKKSPEYLEYPEPVFEDSNLEVKNLFAQALGTQKKATKKPPRTKDKERKETEPYEGLPLAEPHQSPTKNKGKESLDQYPEPVFEDSNTEVKNLFANVLGRPSDNPVKRSRAKGKGRKDPEQPETYEGLPLEKPHHSEHSNAGVKKFFSQGLKGPTEEPTKDSQTKDKVRKETLQPEQYEGLPLDQAPRQNETKEKGRKKKKKEKEEPYEGLPLELAPWQHGHNDKERKVPEVPELYDGLPLDLSPWQYDYEETEVPESYEGLPLNPEPRQYGNDNKERKVSEEPKSYECPKEEPQRHRAKGEGLEQAHYDLENPDDIEAARKFAKKMRKKERAARVTQQLEDTIRQALSFAPVSQAMGAKEKGSEEVPFDQDA